MDRITQKKPKSLEEFMRREEEIAVFEGFKQTEIGLHDGFKEQTVFDRQRLEFTKAQNDHKPLQKLQEGLLSTLRSHELDADLRDKVQDSGWEEIMTLYKQQVEEKDATKAENNKLIKMFRQGGNVAGVAEGLVRMIPDEKGLSILREGLAYVILVWVRYIQTRDKIIETFSTIPVIISNFHSTWAIYRYDVRIQHAFDDFLSLAFESLGKLIEILIPHANGMTSWTKRVFKRFTNQEADEVSRLDSGVENACNKISLLFEQLSHERTADIQNTGRASLREAQAIRKSTHHITTILTDIRDRLSRVEEQQRSRSSTTNTRDQNTLMMVSPQMVSVMQTELYQVICEKEYAKYYGLWSPAHHSESRRLDEPPIQTDKQLLATYLNSTNCSFDAEENMKAVLRNNYSMTPEGLDRAHSLMSHGRFKNFIIQEEPALLLVDGHCEEEGIGRTSPLSVWCASFIAALKQSPSVVVVHYFCGLHTRPGRALSGPLGLAKCLASQLLAYDIATDASPIYVSKEVVERAGEDDVDAICAIIKALLLKLCQTKAVFCVLDNVCEFERSTWGNWLKDLMAVFETLYGLVVPDKTGAGISLKIILTSASRSTHLIDKVKRSEHVSLCGEDAQSGNLAVRGSARHNPGNLLLPPQIGVPGSWNHSRQSSRDRRAEQMTSYLVDAKVPPELENEPTIGSEEGAKPEFI